jgi:uncharacterized OB-fold protein
VTRPVPQPSPLSAPFWEAARHGRLELQRCGRCRRYIHFPDFLCPTCGSDDLRFESVDGHGRIDTFTVVHRVFVPGFEQDAPYAVGWVLLDAQPGLRVFAGLVDVPRDGLAIGLPVTACFTEREGWGLMLGFTPDDAIPVSATNSREAPL